MDAFFEKINAIRKRTHATYRVAKCALVDPPGELVDS